MRLKIAENMVKAVTDAPHVTALFEADFSAIAAHKAALAKKGMKLSYTAYIVKAAADAMAVAPAINGRWEDDRIAVSPTIDIGVGTALGDKGLVVPVVKDAGALSLEQIGARLDDLTAPRPRGQADRRRCFGRELHHLQPRRVGQPARRADHPSRRARRRSSASASSRKRVVVREVDGEDAIVIRPMAYVTLTIDHRVVDGHQTNAWLSRFVEISGELARGLERRHQHRAATVMIAVVLIALDRLLAIAAISLEPRPVPRGASSSSSPQPSSSTSSRNFGVSPSRAKRTRISPAWPSL